MFEDDAYYRFKDRMEASYILAEQLKDYKGDNGVVLAVPRGGVPMGYIIAKELGFALDIAVTKKIGHPMHKEYAIGAVSFTDYFISDYNGVSDEYLEKEIPALREKLKRNFEKFEGGNPPEKLAGRTVIIVDDGIATGNTMLITVSMIRKQNPAKLIIAVPVASKQAIEMLSGEVDEIVCPLVPDFFTGIGAFYENFEQVSDEEVIYYLSQFRGNAAA